MAENTGPREKMAFEMDDVGEWLGQIARTQSGRELTYSFVVFIDGRFEHISNCAPEPLIIGLQELIEVLRKSIETQAGASTDDRVGKVSPRAARRGARGTARAHGHD